MLHLQITNDISKTPWTDVPENVYAKGLGNIDRIGRLPRGMQSGKSSIGILVTMPDGSQVMAQTSMDLFQMAASALRVADAEAHAATQQN